MVYEIESWPHTWTNLVKAFLAQYDHIIDTTPYCMALMTMEKKKTKSFKEYAHRWRAIVSRLDPKVDMLQPSCVFKWVLVFWNVAKNPQDIMISQPI